MPKLRASFYREVAARNRLVRAASEAALVHRVLS
jgi:hypothetical protein